MTNKFILIKKGSRYIIGAAVLVVGLGDAAFGLNKEGDYYLINNGEDLKEFAAIVNKGEFNAKGKLMNDIKLNRDKSKQWIPIGTYENKFIGELISCDGRTKIISGLYINNEGEYANQGLFGCIGRQGTVKDIKISDSYVYGHDNVGGIAGFNAGKIENCVVNFDVVVKGVVFAGGNIGWNMGTMKNCENRGKVEGEYDLIGGNVGFNEGTIEKCNNSGKIEGSIEGYYIGGNVGYNSGSITGNCYNSGEVKGGYYAGGNVGWNYHKGIINKPNLKNTGTVNGESADIAKKIGYQR